MPFRLDDPPPRTQALAPDLEREAGIARAVLRARAIWDQGEQAIAAGDHAAGRTLLERAHRLAPADRNLAFALAVARLRTGAPGAVELFEAIARRHGTREAWSGLAASALASGRVGLAVEAVGRALGYAADAGTRGLAARVAAAAGLDGWCGLDADGALHVRVARPDARPVLTVDGREVGGLPAPIWSEARLELRIGRRHLLGSPLDVAAIYRTEGLIDLDETGLHGWAWHPGAPETDPALRIVAAAGGADTFIATELADAVQGDVPLARPRRFHRPAPPGVVRVLGRDGRDLLGSPIDPAAAARTVPAGPRPPPSREPPDVVVPVYRGLATTLACLRSVLANLPEGSRVHVVDDASPDDDLVRAVRALAAADARLRMIHLASNRGFPGAANAGLAACAGRDAVLLNSDTLVPPGWLRTLREAAHSAPDIGTATPISNDATILGYPVTRHRNRAPGAREAKRLARLARAANAGRLVEIPTAHGFCMFIRADCWGQTGALREDLFAQGYGEENDFCVRATALGWRHVAVPEVYVAHVGHASFAPGGGDGGGGGGGGGGDGGGAIGAAAALARRNLAILNRVHPGYDDAIGRWIEADPLRPARARLDTARWRQRRVASGAVLLVTHAAGGGVARLVEGRLAAIRAEGRRPIVLAADAGGCRIADDGEPYPNLRFQLPGDGPTLARLLARDRPDRMEVHHLLGHEHAILSLAARLAIPYEVWIHDYALLCPRITLVPGEAVATPPRYCGEPALPGCEACIALSGSNLEEPIGVAALRARSAADLAQARRVVVPSRDVGARLRRYFPRVSPVVERWEPDAGSPGAATPGLGDLVAVIGAIGREKGVRTLLACARDAAARHLALRFVVVGYTTEDEALEATGRVEITGPFAAPEAVTLIQAQRAGLAFLPSIWPETWCFTLSDAWAAGLPAAVFDIGTPAERVRDSGRGWVLPLGLGAPGVNDALVRWLAARRVPAQFAALPERNI